MGTRTAWRTEGSASGVGEYAGNSGAAWPANMIQPAAQTARTYKQRDLTFTPRSYIRRAGNRESRAACSELSGFAAYLPGREAIEEALRGVENQAFWTKYGVSQPISSATAVLRRSPSSMVLRVRRSIRPTNFLSRISRISACARLSSSPPSWAGHTNQR
jgi:hypothetical protein